MTKYMRNLDIIVPVQNEAKNVGELAHQINHALKPTGIDFKVIFIVDKSTDNTLKELKNISTHFPIVIRKKIGKPGKGYSILEGLDVSDAEIVGFIDGDLQYPPNAIPEMYKKLLEQKAGVIIANRKTYKSRSKLRLFGSKANVLIFGKLLLGLDYDIQSGLKLFRKDIAKHIYKPLVTPWTFDIPLLYAAKELNQKIKNSFSRQVHLSILVY